MGEATSSGGLLQANDDDDECKLIESSVCSDLSHGGCLSAFRWDGGGRGWSVARPPDAELLLHLLATYLDLVVPGGDFSARHVSAAPAPPARPLALHRVARSPPHYALVLGDETIEVSPSLCLELVVTRIHNV